MKRKRKSLLIAVLVSGLVSATALAGDDDLETPKEVAAAFAPVVKAAGLAFKGDKRLPQCQVLDTYALAIRTAGGLHEKDSLKALEELLAHPDTRFARTAAEALAGYGDLPEKQKAKLVKRLVKALGKAARKLGNKDDELAKHADQVTKALDSTLATLTDASALSEGEEARTADEWEALLAEQARRKK